jgi:nitric-oxide synthase, bacterial
MRCPVSNAPARATCLQVARPTVRPGAARWETGPARPLASTVKAALDLEQVHGFFEQYREHTQIPRHAWRRRIEDVYAEIEATGTYSHTPDELTVGAKIAWFNHARCVGKLYWRSLTVRDCRHVTSPDQISAACFEHLRVAANGGKIRPLISIFAPDRPGQAAVRTRNAQIVAYAGYRTPDGSVIGDAASVELTRLAQDCGWSAGRPGAFDLLPLVLETPDGGVTAHPIPPELACEVPIEHPTLPGLANLGLRWYGFPSVSDMALTIGGIVYPFAPFTGWYVAPEISARDFTDSYRYNLLPDIAASLGLNTEDPRSLWKDRAMIELTAAVLWSFERAGLRIDDHHAATERFHRWTQAERRRGHAIDAEWAWVVPPISASATPVFHESYSSEHRLPNFFRMPKISANPGFAAPCGN